MQVNGLLWLVLVLVFSSKRSIANEKRNRMMDIRATQKKKWFHHIRFCAGLFVIVGLVSCSPNYDYIGVWQSQSNRGSYVNLKHRIGLSFPNEQWQIDQRPSTESENNWEIPKRGSTSPYHLLKAYFPPDLKMEILVHLAATDTSLEKYMALRRYQHLTNKFHDNYEAAPTKIFLNKHDREIGVIRAKVEENGMDGIQLQAIYKEKCSFTILSFFSPVDSFELRRSQIWEIIHSYKSHEARTLDCGDLYLKLGS